MIRTRGILFLVAAAGFAFLAVNLLTREREAPKPPSEIRVVIAARDIAAGTPFSGDHLTDIPWRGHRIPEGAFGDPKAIQGRVAASRILKGELVTEKRLVPQGEHPESELSLRIEPGMRALTLSVDADTGMTEQLEPGDRVDLIVSSALSDESGARISRVIGANIRVLAIAPAHSGAGADKQRAVTLLMSPDAATAVLSAESERIRLAVRNPYDQATEAQDAVIFNRYQGPVSQNRLRRMTQERFERLCADIPQGMRAVTVAVINQDGVCGRLWRGSRVDLVGTHEFVSTTAINPDEAVVTGVQRLSKIVMENLEVLAADSEVMRFAPGYPASSEEEASPSEEPQNRLPSPGSQIVPVRRVTLLASPEDAEKLIVLSETSRIRLILRQEDDLASVEPSEREGAKGEEVFGKKTFTDVEIIRGTQKGRKRFEGDAEESMPLPEKRPPRIPEI